MAIRKYAVIVYKWASIGIALCPTDGDSAAELVVNANVAIYQAKAQGPAMKERVERV